MNPAYALAGKAVMVTGAGRGIGHAVARAFAAQGCRLLAVDRDTAALQSAKPDFSATADVATIACDLGHDADLDQLQAATRAFSDRLDVLVNNAGTEYQTPMAANQGRSEDEVLQDILSAQAVSTLLGPKDIAGIYLFLASNDARPITGQAIVVSNGEVMH